MQLPGQPTNKLCFCFFLTFFPNQVRHTLFGNALFLDPVPYGASQTRFVLLRISRPATESTDRSSSSFILANNSPSWANLAADNAPGISKNLFTSCKVVVMLNLQTKRLHNSTIILCTVQFFTSMTLNFILGVTFKYSKCIIQFFYDRKHHWTKCFKFKLFDQRYWNTKIQLHLRYKMAK